MPLSPESERFAWAWGSIVGQVAERASTAQVFAAVNQAAEDAGFDTGPGLWQAVNEMRSMAAVMRNGAEAFQAANPDATFTWQLAPLDINARDPETRALFPEYLVRFDMTYLDDQGEEVTSTKTMRGDWAPGMTVQDVLGEVNEAAEGLAMEYGVELISVDNLRPVSI